MYSFIVPRKKNTLDTFAYMWIGFITFVLISLVAVGIYFKTKNAQLSYEKEVINSKIQELKKEEKEKLKIINLYKRSYELSVEAKKSNNLLKSGLQNLLSFVPDQIVLTKMIFDKYEVKLFGYTDSPQTYKLLLEPPLKSIFDITKVGFTKVNENKYLFSSDNKIKRAENEK